MNGNRRISALLRACARAFSRPPGRDAARCHGQGSAAPQSRQDGDFTSMGSGTPVSNDQSPSGFSNPNRHWLTEASWWAPSGTRRQDQRSYVQPSAFRGSQRNVLHARVVQLISRRSCSTACGFLRRRSGTIGDELPRPGQVEKPPELDERCAAVVDPQIDHAIAKPRRSRERSGNDERSGLGSARITACGLAGIQRGTHPFRLRSS
jgi:hypothetical protein